MSLLLNQSKDPFLKNIITGNKKFFFYDNVQCKRQWIDRQISTAYPKAKTSWEENYAGCMVGSLRHYSF